MSTHSPPERHLGPLARQDDTVLFNAAILRLVPSRSHKAMVELFDGRFSYHAIKLWRRGVRSPSKEAVAILCARLSERARRDLEFIHKLPSLAGPGRGSHRNICKWNRVRAMRKAGVTVE